MRAHIRALDPSGSACGEKGAGIMAGFLEEA